MRKQHLLESTGQTHTQVGTPQVSMAYNDAHSTRYAPAQQEGCTQPLYVCLFGIYTVESSACIHEPPSFTLSSALHCFAQEVVFPMEYNKSHLPLAEVSPVHHANVVLGTVHNYYAGTTCMHAYK